MQDFRPSPFRRLALMATGLMLGIGSGAAWWQQPSLINGLFLALGMWLAWWFVSRSRARLVLFDRQGLYWDGFHHFLLQRERCRLCSLNPAGLNLLTGGEPSSASIDLGILEDSARQSLAEWCTPHIRGRAREGVGASEN